MGIFGRFRQPRGSAAAHVRGMRDSDLAHLADWAAARTGVEGFVEPPTFVNEMTVVLVAKDGEWTRRRVHNAKIARRVGEKLGIPLYDVQKTGYPQRMRDHNERQRIIEKRARQERDRD
ncbi:oxidoreductase [Lolliginicoccus levis]|uniref:oxidoreductase n=1 Tax=Lolliginicoccus levis TaxID=2919542 RepID=UPI00241DB744|nr:oxidoreductase [Lolliginicoccus levis]